MGRKGYKLDGWWVQAVKCVGNIANRGVGAAVTGAFEGVGVL
jgi:hypothetical protein